METMAPTSGDHVSISTQTQEIATSATSVPTGRTEEWSSQCPTCFRAVCHEAAQGGANGYVRAGHFLMGLLPQVLEHDDDEPDLRLGELQHLVQGERPRSESQFLASPDATRVWGWLSHELPRCVALIPARRRVSALRGVYRYVVTEERDLTDW